MKSYQLLLSALTSRLRAKRPPRPEDILKGRGVGEGWQAGVPCCPECVTVAGRSREQRCLGLRTAQGPVARPAWHAVHLPARTGAPRAPAPLTAADMCFTTCFMPRSAVPNSRTAPSTPPPRPHRWATPLSLPAPSQALQQGTCHFVVARPLTSNLVRPGKALTACHCRSSYRVQRAQGALSIHLQAGWREPCCRQARHATIPGQAAGEHKLGVFKGRFTACYIVPSVLGQLRSSGRLHAGAF